MKKAVASIILGLVTISSLIVYINKKESNIDYIEPVSYEKKSETIDYALPTRISTIVDESKNQRGLSFASVLEDFYETDTDIYYFTCAKSNFIKVKYIDGSEENIKDALKKGNITIEDLDDYDIKYIKEAK